MTDEVNYEIDYDQNPEYETEECQNLYTIVEEYAIQIQDHENTIAEKNLEINDQTIEINEYKDQILEWESKYAEM